MLLDKLRKSPTIIALAGTAFAYLLGYVYQSAYLKQFDVSAYEIEVSINNLVIAAIGLFVILFAVDQLAVLYRSFFWDADSNKPSNRYLRNLVKIAGALLLTLAYFDSIKMPGLAAFAIVSAVIFLLFAAEPLWHFRKGKKPADALKEMYVKKDAEVKNPEKVTTYFEKYGSYVKWTLFLLATASIGGQLHASLLTNFYVASEEGSVKELIVLKNGDTFITKSYDTATQAFESGYTINKVQDEMKMNELFEIGK